MDLFNEVTEENLMMYAARNYYNPRSTHIEEFYEDLKRFVYIKRLVNKYEETGRLSERLILNHLIVAFNVFGIQPGLKILELKINKNQMHIIKPFLVFLKYITPDQYTGIKMDPYIVQQLRKI